MCIPLYMHRACLRVHASIHAQSVSLCAYLYICTECVFVCIPLYMHRACPRVHTSIHAQSVSSCAYLYTCTERVLVCIPLYMHRACPRVHTSIHAQSVSSCAFLYTCTERVLVCIPLYMRKRLTRTLTAPSNRCPWLFHLHGPAGIQTSDNGAHAGPDYDCVCVCECVNVLIHTAIVLPFSHNKHTSTTSSLPVTMGPHFLCKYTC